MQVPQNLDAVASEVLDTAVAIDIPLTLSEAKEATLRYWGVYRCAFHDVYERLKREGFDDSEAAVEAFHTATRGILVSMRAVLN